MRILRQLADDGLEDLGVIELGGTVVLGCPSLLLAPAGAGQWYGSGVRAGRWHLLGRPWSVDRDLLEEVILAHESALGNFYTAYDEATRAASLALPRHRLVIVDGTARTDTATLRSMVEVDDEALPWVTDRGAVFAGIGEHGVQVIAARTRETLLIAASFGPPPPEIPAADPFTHDQATTADDDDV
ncbi:MAG: hypothetical protein ABMA64_21990 [Myxococcota bacterium]